MFWIEVASFLHILHQSSHLHHRLLQCWSLIPLYVVYVQIVVWYIFAFGCTWFFSLLWDTNICLRLSYLFLLWPWCPTSPNWLSHLGSGQTMMSMTNTSCYHPCNDYFSCGELWCQMMIIKLLPQGSVLGNPLHFSTQWLCLHHRSTGHITWQEIAGLYFYHPHSVVSRTLHSVWSMGMIN